jgi:hypothetical protein
MFNIKKLLEDAGVDISNNITPENYKEVLMDLMDDIVSSAEEYGDDSFLDEVFDDIEDYIGAALESTMSDDDIQQLFDSAEDMETLVNALDFNAATIVYHNLLSYYYSMFGSDNSQDDLDDINIIGVPEIGESTEETNVEEEKWSGDVKTKRHPPKGLFAEGSAQDIADWAAGAGDLQSAMAEINFYENRAGSNLSAERKATLEKAKELLRKKFNKED